MRGLGVLTWLDLVSSGCVLDGVDGGLDVVVEGGAGVRMWSPVWTERLR